ncbi:MAG: hypothetical protein HYT80_00420 [Euryarchaeota archaeon]|nr:hypothetical protein [Euryarchaeota archaeon]
MVDAAYLATKILHVTLASMWVGGGLLNLLVLQPVLLKALPGTRQEVMGRLAPPLFRYNSIVGGLVLASGALLVTLHPNGWDGLTKTPWGRVVLFAIIVTVAVLYLAGTSVRATMKVMAKVVAATKPGEEPPMNLRFLQARLRFTTFLMNGLVLLVLFVMVFANALYAGP